MAVHRKALGDSDKGFELTGRKKPRCQPCASYTFEGFSNEAICANTLPNTRNAKLSYMGYLKKKKLIRRLL